jgi:hypothetical protein
MRIKTKFLMRIGQVRIHFGVKERFFFEEGCKGEAKAQRRNKTELRLNFSMKSKPSILH